MVKLPHIPTKVDSLNRYVVCSLIFDTKYLSSVTYKCENKKPLIFFSFSAILQQKARRKFEVFEFFFVSKQGEFPKKMQGDPDSTQTNGPTSNLKENRLVRFIKPNVGEVSDCKCNLFIYMTLFP